MLPTLTALAPKACRVKQLEKRWKLLWIRIEAVVSSEPSLTNAPAKPWDLQVVVNRITVTTEHAVAPKSQEFK